MFLGSLEKERESQVCLGLSRQCARPPLIFAFFFSRSLAEIDKHHMNNIKFNGHQVVQVGCLFVKVRCLLARLLKLDVSCLKFSFFFLGPFFFCPLSCRDRRTSYWGWPHCQSLACFFFAHLSEIRVSCVCVSVSECV